MVDWGAILYISSIASLLEPWVGKNGTDLPHRIAKPLLSGCREPGWLEWMVYARAREPGNHDSWDFFRGEVPTLAAMRSARGELLD